MQEWIWTETEYRTRWKIELQSAETVPQCKFFIEQPGEKPVGKKIQPDMGTDAKAVFAVVPRCQILFREKRSGGKFTEEDKRSVDAASKYEGHFVNGAI